MITPALIVGGALELPVEMTAYLVSMAMVASGVGTYLQVNRFGPVGSGMLSIQSVNFSFVTVMIALGAGMKEGGLTKDAMISTLLVFKKSAVKKHSKPFSISSTTCMPMVARCCSPATVRQQS